MKVKIGNYPKRLVCNTHTNHMNSKYGMDWPEKGDQADLYFEATEDMIQSFYNIFNWLWFDRRKQKIVIKIEKHDTWSMDSTLSHIVLPMLIQLKATQHGHPANLTEQEWDDILDEMIWAFEQKCRDDGWEGDYYTYEEDKDAAFGLKLVWEDRKGQKAHQKRMTNGFSLFGKYYEGLWD
jgi:hypothetical protein